MLATAKTWILHQGRAAHFFRLALIGVALVALVQTYWLMPRHFTQVDDIGVAESLMVRNMDYRDDCAKNVQDMRGKALLWVFKNPERVCKITTKLNRFSIVSSLWTYAPVQFWLTQAFLNPHKSYTYEEVKYWGRLPSFIFYLLGILSFYWLLRTQFKEFSTQPILVLSLTVFMSLSLEERIHAAQMHSYAIGIFANAIALYAYLKLLKLNEKSYWSILGYSFLFALSVGMQYQAILLVLACLMSIFFSNLLDHRGLGRRWIWRYSALASSTLIFSYCIVGNILSFSSRGANWNAGPNGEFVVQGNTFFEKTQRFFHLIISQTPENLYSIISGIELPNTAAYIFGLGCFALMALGILYLWRRRAIAFARAILIFFGAYACVYGAFIFVGKLTFSPTRHFLFYLPVAILLMGYGALEIRKIGNQAALLFLKYAFLSYCFYSLVAFSAFSENRLDKVSEGYFNTLMQQSNASFLIFDGFDIEPFFSESLSGNPMFWFATGGFNCAHKEILIPEDRRLYFLSYGKPHPLTLPNPNLEKYIKEIVDNCTSHTALNNKEIRAINSKGYWIKSPSTTSVEFSSQVLNSISINNQFIDLYEMRLNFDSHLYPATLEEGIDFAKPAYPTFLKYVAGIAQRENWGRWTDANQSEHVLLGFAKPLPKHFAIELRAVPFSPNISKSTRIRVGNQESLITVDGRSDSYRLEFENNTLADMIEIIPPHSELKQGTQSNLEDPRSIGVGLVYLKIKTLD